MHDHHLHQHLHAELEKRQQADVGGGTVVEYVYKTAEKDFDGPIGGYTTLNAPQAQPSQTSQDQDDSKQSSSQNSNQSSNDDDQSDSDQQKAQQSANDAAVSSAKEAAASAAIKSANDANAKQTATAKSDDDDAKSTSKTPKPTQQKTQTAPTPTPTQTNTDDTAAATSSLLESSPTSSSESSGSSSSGGGGLSGGAKAGIAFGVIFAILAIAVAAFLLYRRKKKQDNEAYQHANDEKSAAFDAGPALQRSQSNVSTRTTATAPRLSLRPVTEFHPDLAGRAKAAQAGAGAGAAGIAAMSNTRNSGKENPFADHAVAPQSRRLSDKHGLPIQQNAPENPFGNHAEAPAPSNGAAVAPKGDAPEPLRVRTPSPESAGSAAAIGGAAALAGAGAMAATKKDRQERPRDLSLQHDRPVTPGAQSPALSEFSQHSGTPNGPPTNVHRVQLDFKPSMDDELELKAGALVRLLHEYDDGWALCIRLDRSQQGVAPRTCLSARPVKPRPPPGQARGPGPRGPPQGAMGPNGPQRPASPAGGRGSPAPSGRQPRPMGPPNGQQRSMSPGPYGGGPQPRSMSPGPYGGGPQSPRGQNGKRRSNSASDISSRRNSPPGPSRMNPMMQRVPMKEQAIAHPDRPASPAVGRKPVPGQAM